MTDNRQATPKSNTNLQQQPQKQHAKKHKQPSRRVSPLRQKTSNAQVSHFKGF